jgi:hypothetical protein
VPNRPAIVPFIMRLRRSGLHSSAYAEVAPSRTRRVVVLPTSWRSIAKRQSAPAQSFVKNASCLPSCETAGAAILPENVSCVRSRRAADVSFSLNASFATSAAPPATSATTATAPTSMGVRERCRDGADASLAPEALGAAVGAASSARLNSATDANRSAGTLESAFAIAASTGSGTVGRTVLTCIAGSVSSLAITAWTVLPVIGGSPTSIS